MGPFFFYLFSFPFFQPAKVACITFWRWRWSGFFFVIIIILLLVYKNFSMFCVLVCARDGMRYGYGRGTFMRVKIDCLIYRKFWLVLSSALVLTRSGVVAEPVSYLHG